jgi:hypothetical protein
MLYLLSVCGSGPKSRILAEPEPQHRSLKADICRALKEAAAVINESPSALQVKSDCLAKTEICSINLFQATHMYNFSW